MNKITIDAKNQKIGRVASQAAEIVMGKNNVNFIKNEVYDVKVEIINASLMDIDSTKMRSKLYQNYSGYPGGRKVRTLENVIERKGPEEVLRIAIKGMLPQNKLKTPRLLNVTITK